MVARNLAETFIVLIFLSKNINYVEEKCWQLDSFFFVRSLINVQCTLKLTISMGMLYRFVSYHAIDWSTISTQTSRLHSFVFGAGGICGSINHDWNVTHFISKVFSNFLFYQCALCCNHFCTLYVIWIGVGYLNSALLLKLKKARELSEWKFFFCNHWLESRNEMRDHAKYIKRLKELYKMNYQVTKNNEIK